MKTLRLFVNNNLENPINWVMVNDDGTTESGAATFAEISLFEDAGVEIYLSTSCCSIFKTSMLGISSKRLTEELVLGLIEESLTDEIDEVKAITLMVEDDIAYVAVFNKAYYDSLMHLIQDLHKPIRFIQSFAFTTEFQEGSWTVFLSDQQRFLRTSKFEYYSLDDQKPVPSLLEDMLISDKPKSLLIYADETAEYNIEQIAKQFDIECRDATNQFVYGIPVWNFYIQKSTSFNIKLDKSSKISLLRLLRVCKFLVIFLVAFWVLDIIMLEIDGYRLQSQIKDNLKGVVATTQINRGILQTASDKINNLRHQRGIYDDKDAVVLLTKLLQIISTIGPNDIKQVDYNNGEMQVVLGSGFDPSQFTSYQNVLETRQVIATIEDYKVYAKKIKKNSEEANNNLNAQTQAIVDGAWVITLKPALWHDAIRNN